MDLLKDSIPGTSLLEPQGYVSPEFLNLKENLDKKIITQKQIKKGNQKFNIFFKLLEIDGEATFILQGEDSEVPILVSEADLAKIDGGSLSTTYALVNKIKNAQGYALQSFGNLESHDSLFSSYQTNPYEGKDIDDVPFDDVEIITIVNMIKDKHLYDSMPERTPRLAFFSKAEIQKRIGKENIEDLIGFKENVQETLLRNSQDYKRNGSLRDFHLEVKDKSEPIRISLKGIPFIKWVTLINYIDENTPQKTRMAGMRNFRWELRFLGSNDVLGSAKWNDLAGIKKLVNRLENTKELMITQGLLNSGFFK